MLDMTTTIEAKSDQLNADDLIGSPKTIKITTVKACTGDQPIAVSYEGDNGKPYKPNKAMRRVMVAVWGKDGESYAGKSMTLYNDSSVKWAGKEVGGIRISHMSDMKNKVVIPIAITRGQKIPFTVTPLEVKAEKTIEEMRVDCIEALSKKGVEVPADKIGEAKTKEELTAIYKEAIK